MLLNVCNGNHFFKCGKQFQKLKEEARILLDEVHNRNKSCAHEQYQKLSDFISTLRHELRVFVSDCMERNEMVRYWNGFCGYYI